MLGSNVNTEFALKDDAKRITNPEFIVNVSYNKDIKRNELPGWDYITTPIIISLWGDKGGITNNTKSLDKWIKKGAMMFKEYFNSKVQDYVSNSPTIKEYWAFKPERLHDKLDYYNRPLLDALYKNNAACAVFGIKNNLTDVDKMYLTLWTYLVNETHKYNRPPDIKKILDDLEAIPLDPINDDVIAKFTNNPLIRLIDASGFSNLMNSTDPTSPTAVKAVEILVTALNQ